MPDNYAIRMDHVSKVYRLHGSQLDQLIDVLGLQRFGIRPKSAPKEFVALSDVTLSVKRGQRLGIIGRNGAGKTTLLKLICGNFQQSKGDVEVNGKVQALMNVGLGFHPEYTGRQNIEASLQYNGLPRQEYEKALEGIIDFCELGQFIDQPFKTYSLGMQARLMFAAATAIRPDILIVDEVLGAGDAYFVAKSKSRVENLVRSGCTMLLVSHSMQQVLELCDEAIWLENGRIQMEGPAFLVVKAYEAHLHGPIAKIAPTSINSSKLGFDLENQKFISSDNGGYIGGTRTSIQIPEELRFQEPFFFPHLNKLSLASPADSAMNSLAPGGVSRWESDEGLKVVGFTTVGERGANSPLVSIRPGAFIIDLVAESTGEYNCRYGIAIHDPMGACVTRIFSPGDVFSIQQGRYRRIRIDLNPCQLGPGEYTVGISVLKYCALEMLNSSERYDLLSRSFSLKIELPESLDAISCNFFHSAEWKFES